MAPSFTIISFTCFVVQPCLLSFSFFLILRTTLAIIQVVCHSLAYLLVLLSPLHGTLPTSLMPMFYFCEAPLQHGLELCRHLLPLVQVATFFYIGVHLSFLVQLFQFTSDKSHYEREATCCK
jgi:hypothetical protein